MKVITKENLIERLSELNDIESKAAATRAVNLILDTIITSVASGDKVSIGNFATFTPAVQAAKPARPGHNPSTGEPLTIAAQPEKSVVRIKPLGKFKDAVAGN